MWCPTNWLCPHSACLRNKIWTLASDVIAKIQKLVFTPDMLGKIWFKKCKEMLHVGNTKKSLLWEGGHPARAFRALGQRRKFSRTAGLWPWHLCVYFSPEIWRGRISSPVTPALVQFHTGPKPDGIKHTIAHTIVLCMHQQRFIPSVIGISARCETALAPLCQAWTSHDCLRLWMSVKNLSLCECELWLYKFVEFCIFM